jgi:hypothetical protein
MRGNRLYSFERLSNQPMAVWEPYRLSLARLDPDATFCRSKRGIIVAEAGAAEKAPSAGL